MIKKLLFFSTFFLLSIFSVSSFSGSVCDSVTSYYSFDNDASDLSGNNNDGVVNGPLLGQGIIGNGYDFNGNTGNIQISTDVSNYLNMTQGTISFWYKPNGISDDDVALFAYQKSGDALFLNFYQKRILYLQHKGNLGNYESVTKSVVNLDDDDIWHHVVGTWDINGESISLSLTYDSEVLTSNITLTDPGFYSGLASIGNGFNGTIDELIIYDRVINESEINLLYNNGFGHELYCGFFYSQCNNTLDDDGDGFVDLDDAGCLDVNDIDERFCGDSYIDNNEVCDIDNLSGQTCTSLNSDYESGILSCLSDCSYYNFSLCTLPECVDLDGDGYGNPGIFTCPIANVSDCDDINPNRNPGIREGPFGSNTCSDGIDNDCDGLIDSADSKCDEFTFLPSFPGAEGFGAVSKGGRGGQVIKVTNLNDSGVGSLRAAIESTGPRTVVFDVSGIIDLKSDLMVTNPFITIAGQTSPDGILITSWPFRIHTHEVIVQHMRFRLGTNGIAFDTYPNGSWIYYTTPQYKFPPTGPGGSCIGNISTKEYGFPCAIEGGAEPESHDAVSIFGNSDYDYVNPAYNIILDHCSISWGVDETFEVSLDATNITVQNSIISEGLKNAGHPEKFHAFGFILWGSRSKNPMYLSFHHNYLANNKGRNPLMSGANYYAPYPEVFSDVVNNVAYNTYDGGVTYVYSKRKG